MIVMVVCGAVSSASIPYKYSIRARSAKNIAVSSILFFSTSCVFFVVFLALLVLKKNTRSPSGAGSPDSEEVHQKVKKRVIRCVCVRERERHE